MDLPGFRGGLRPMWRSPAMLLRARSAKGMGITVDLRSSRNGRNIDAAPTDVVQQIVSHAEAGANARLAFPKRVPGQGRTRPKESRGAIFCKQRIANPGLGEQDPVRSLSEAGGRFIVGMVAV